MHVRTIKYDWQVNAANSVHSQCCEISSLRVLDIVLPAMF